MAQNNLTTTIQQLDSNGVTLARRLKTFSDAAPTIGEFLVGTLTTVNQTTVTFPTNITQLRQLLLVNTHASAKITVVWTPNGVSEQTILVLGPGDIIAFWNQTTGATKGISTLKLQSDTINASYELFVGA